MWAPSRAGSRLGETRRTVDWAEWNPAVAARSWTVGLEEESMLLEPAGWSSSRASRTCWPAYRRASSATQRPRPTRASWSSPLDRTGRSRRRSPSSAACVESSRARSPAVACAPPWRARTRPSSGTTSRSRPTRATSASTTRCGRSRTASRRSRYTCTWACRTRCALSVRWTGSASTSRCCSRCRPTRRTGRAATPGSPPRGSRSSRCSRRPRVPRGSGERRRAGREPRPRPATRDGRRARARRARPLAQRGLPAQASAFALSRSNSSWVMVPLSSRPFARSISPAEPPPSVAVLRT